MGGGSGVLGRKGGVGGGGGCGGWAGKAGERLLRVESRRRRVRPGRPRVRVYGNEKQSTVKNIGCSRAGVGRGTAVESRKPRPPRPPRTVNTRTREAIGCEEYWMQSGGGGPRHGGRKPQATSPSKRTGVRDEGRGTREAKELFREVIPGRHLAVPAASASKRAGVGRHGLCGGCGGRDAV